MAMVWSTDQVRPQDRLGWWVEVVCRTLVPVDCIARRDRPFSSRIEASALGSIRVSAAAGSAQTASRQPRKIDRNPQDDVTLALHGRGASVFTQFGRGALLGPGDIILSDMNRPFEFNFPADWAQTILMFPREALLSRIGDVGPHLGVKIDGTIGVAGVLATLLSGLPNHLDRIPDHVRERVADNLLDLIATVILASRDRPLESSRMTLARVKLWIERHLGEALSAESIAIQCGLSSRHLNRLFARENTSLMQFVLERRLTRCHRDLADPTMRGRSVTDIALTAGFNDLSHSSRTYRARYGCAAKETRLSTMCRARGHYA
jgi:AraC-like DNA-binding protein